MGDGNMCPQCQHSLPADAPEGLCPECLLKVAVEGAHGSNTRVRCSIRGHYRLVQRWHPVSPEAARGPDEKDSGGCGHL